MGVKKCTGGCGKYINDDRLYCVACEKNRYQNDGFYTPKEVDTSGDRNPVVYERKRRKRGVGRKNITEQIEELKDLILYRKNNYGISGKVVRQILDSLTIVEVIERKIDETIYRAEQRARKKE